MLPLLTLALVPRSDVMEKPLLMISQLNCICLTDVTGVILGRCEGKNMDCDVAVHKPIREQSQV